MSNPFIINDVLYNSTTVTANNLTSDSGSNTVKSSTGFAAVSSGSFTSYSLIDGNCYILYGTTVNGKPILTLTKSAPGMCEHPDAPINVDLVHSIHLRATVREMREEGIEIVEGGPRFKISLGDIFVLDEFHQYVVNDFMTILTIYDPNLEMIAVALEVKNVSDPLLTFAAGYSADGEMSHPSLGSNVISVSNGNSIEVVSRYGTIFSVKE